MSVVLILCWCSTPLHVHPSAYLTRPTFVLFTFRDPSLALHTVCNSIFKVNKRLKAVFTSSITLISFLYKNPFPYSLPLPRLLNKQRWIKQHIHNTVKIERQIWSRTFVTRTLWHFGNMWIQYFLQKLCCQTLHNFLYISPLTKKTKQNKTP